MTEAPISRRVSIIRQNLSHLLLKMVFFRLLLLKGRVTVRKLRTLTENACAYRRRAETAGASPTVALFDVSNRCNLFCPTCRRSRTDVVDLSGQTAEQTGLGELSLERFVRIIDDLHRDLLLATLYVSGEPLLNSDLGEMVAHAGRRGVATMLSTNGMLLDGAMSERLLDAGLDYLKVAVSGFTQDVYGIYHRGGDIETVLRNLAAFERLRRQLGKRCLVVLDYILFEHNRHQVGDLRRFCREHGIIFSLRYGRVLAGSSLESPPESREHYLPKQRPCDWLWKIMVFCHDARAVPCCQFATCATSPLVMGHGDDEPAGAIWNGPSYRELRRQQARGGRRGLPLCENCFYSGIDFQS